VTLSFLICQQNGGFFEGGSKTLQNKQHIHINIPMVYSVQVSVFVPTELYKTSALIRTATAC